MGVGRGEGGVPGRRSSIHRPRGQARRWLMELDLKRQGRESMAGNYGGDGDAGGGPVGPASLGHV